MSAAWLRLDLAPGIDLNVRQLLPGLGETQPDQAWRVASADLDPLAAAARSLARRPTLRMFQMGGALHHQVDKYITDWL